jgi:glycosyltransferase involved in cell wall biosynthesis
VRVLVVHNAYSSRVPSGENLSVADEVAWLRRAGVEVSLHEVSNDTVVAAGPVGKVRQAAETPWSPSAARRFAADLDRVQPDVVHVHNLFPLLTGSVAYAAVRRGVPLVWTCRNRRIVCVEGTHFRDGAPCYACRPGWRLPGIRYGCYQRLAVARGTVSPAGAVAASALVTLATTGFGSLVRRRRVLAVGIADNVAEWLVEVARLPPERVTVKYVGVPGAAEGHEVRPAESGATFLFAGQLADYKGVPLLLDAWARGAPREARLRIVGDGMAAPLVTAAAAADPRITFVGRVDPAAMADELAGARVVVAPSTTPETFGRVAAEALAYGRPVITTGLGGLGEIVDQASGWVTGVDPGAMAGAIAEAAADDAAVATRGAKGREKHRAHFSPEATTEALIDIYERVLREAGHRTERAD